MRKLISFMHTTLDGFVAGTTGEMDWIKVDDEIFDYAGTMTKQSDTALYGRVTFQMMEAYWPTAGDRPNASKHDLEHSGWYNKVPKVVISKTLAPGTPMVQVISDNLSGKIKKIKELQGKDIVIFGSPSAVHSLTRLNLIDEYWLFVNPVLLGDGTPMFKTAPDKTMLTLVDAKVLNCGVVALHYTVNR